MAQLIKLSDYVSRYEIDIYRYPARYVRLKKERWQRLKQDWEARQKGYEALPSWHDYDGKSKTSFFRKPFSKMIPGKRGEIKEEMNLPSESELRHHSLEELKESFRKELFHFQLNWASSTVSEISSLKKGYYHDSLLKQLVQGLPDTFFILYEPVFMLKKAPVDLDIIIVTPTELWLIVPLKGDKQTIFQADNERFWLKKRDESTDRILNPGISLKRMKTVVETILEEKGVSVPIKMAVIAKNSFIDIPSAGTKISLVDKRNIEEFTSLLTRNQSPVKHGQLKVTDTLLLHSVTISQNRMQDEEEYIENDYEPPVENEW